MKRPIAFKHEFVEFIPDKLANRTIYVSMNYATAAHKCACGCGAEIVTPISPTDWKLVFDGRSVSLHPSIGNWSLKCRSHYWIKNNRISWAEDWSRTQIDNARRLDREKSAPQNKASTLGGKKKAPLLERLLNIFRG